MAFPKSDMTLRVVKEKDTLVYPALYFSVYIHGPAWEERAFAHMFSKAWCNKVDSPDKADLIVFTGGEDIDPAIYGEARHHTTHTNPSRDIDDLAMFSYAVEEGIPMLGVCRGAQLGWVGHGGKLYQDVDGHNEGHMMWAKGINRLIKPVSSVHHQACIPGTTFTDVEILGEVAKSTKRWRDDNNFNTGVHQDVEAFFIPDTCFIGVQGHPEYPGYNYYTKWCLDLLEEYIMNNPYMDATGGKWRINISDLEQRKEYWAEKGWSIPSIPSLDEVVVN